MNRRLAIQTLIVILLVACMVANAITINELSNKVEHLEASTEVKIIATEDAINETVVYINENLVTQEDLMIVLQEFYNFLMGQ